MRITLSQLLVAACIVAVHGASPTDGAHGMEQCNALAMHAKGLSLPDVGQT